MVQMSEECIAVMASGRFMPPFVEVPGSTHLDTVVNLAICVELRDGASFGFHHVLAANLANCAHLRTSLLLEKFFSAAIFVDVVVSEPTIILYGGQVEARITLVLLMLNDDCLAFVIRTAAGQKSSYIRYTNRCKELFQWHELAVLINHNKFIGFLEASFSCFFPMPDYPGAGDGAKAHLWVVADLLTQLAAHRRKLRSVLRMRSM